MIAAVVALGLAVLVPADAVDDPGPCPTGTYEWLPAGADYSDGVWSLHGVAFGTGAAEDECWAPVAAWAVATPQPQKLPATR